LTRGTRGKEHPQPAFKVAHLAAGGILLELNSDGVFMKIKAIKSGLYKTVGMPQFGQQDVGISPGGAMDRFAFATGNALLQNEDNAPALEILLAPTLQFEEDGYFVLTGAMHNGVTLSETPEGGSPTPVPHATVCFASAGSVLSFGQKAYGFRAYLCFRPLDTTSKAESPEGRTRGAFDEVCRWVDPDRKIRVVEGPEYSSLNDPHSFLLNAWKTTPDMSDMGMRLENAFELPTCTITNMVSEAVSDGTIQLTPKGPIILLRHRQTVGGYPRIFNVISADLDILAQYAPGQLMWFKKVTIEEALAVARVKNEDLERIKRT